MGFNNNYQEFCDRWLKKAQDYNEASLHGYFDKFFTLFVVYNALYVETAAQLRRKAEKNGRDEYKIEGNSFPDSKAATEYVLSYMGSRRLIEVIHGDSVSKTALDTLIHLIDQQRFSINLDPIWGEPNVNKDMEMLKQLKSRNSGHKAQAILNLIYQIRCNLFHGRKGLNVIQQDILKPAIVILEKVIDALYIKLRKEQYIQKPSLSDNT